MVMHLFFLLLPTPCSDHTVKHADQKWGVCINSFDRCGRKRYQVPLANSYNDVNNDVLPNPGAALELQTSRRRWRIVFPTRFPVTMNSELWCSNMEASFWPADWVFISYLTLAEGLSHTGPLSHGEIRLSLLLNNSVDFFYWLTIPLRLQESREQPFLKQIVCPLLLTFFFVMQKSLSLSYSNLQFFLFTPCTPTSPIPVLQPNSLLLNPFIFIHTNTGLEPLALSRYIARVALWLTAFPFTSRQ